MRNIAVPTPPEILYMSWVMNVYQTPPKTRVVYLLAPKLGGPGSNLQLHIEPRLLCVQELSEQLQALALELRESLPLSLLHTEALWGQAGPGARRNLADAVNR